MYCILIPLFTRSYYSNALSTLLVVCDRTTTCSFLNGFRKHREHPVLQVDTVAVSHDLDIAVVAPERPPGVEYEPVGRVSLLAPSHDLDGLLPQQGAGRVPVDAAAVGEQVLVHVDDGGNGPTRHQIATDHVAGVGEGVGPAGAPQVLVGLPLEVVGLAVGPTARVDGAHGRAAEGALYPGTGEQLVGLAAPGRGAMFGEEDECISEVTAQTRHSAMLTAREYVLRGDLPAADSPDTQSVREDGGSHKGPGRRTVALLAHFTHSPAPLPVAHGVETLRKSGLDGHHQLRQTVVPGRQNAQQVLDGGAWVEVPARRPGVLHCVDVVNEPVSGSITVVECTGQADRHGHSEQTQPHDSTTLY